MIDPRDLELEALRKELAAAKGTPPPPLAVVPDPGPLKLDLGCGKNKREGFRGVDSIAFPGVDDVVDLRGRWPWGDSTVDEVNCSHTIEHFDWPGRVHFFNELWRVLKKGGKASIVMPYWASGRYYGDPTHKEPFAEFAWFYLKKEWRKVNAPHVDAEDLKAAGAPASAMDYAYSCDFDVSYGYNVHPEVTARSDETKHWMLTFCKEAAQDMLATAVALK
jgi:SAM-dependent methyltransferase